MKTTASLFNESLKQVPNDVKLELDMSFAIADKIDAILKQRHLNQKQFAKAMGKSEAEVSRWLGGTHNFTLRTIAKISDTLGVRLI